MAVPDFQTLMLPVLRELAQRGAGIVHAPGGHLRRAREWRRRGRFTDGILSASGADLRDDRTVDSRGIVRAQVNERHGPERSRAGLPSSRLFALRGARPDDEFQPSFAVRD